MAEGEGGRVRAGAAAVGGTKFLTEAITGEGRPELQSSVRSSAQSALGIVHDHERHL